MNTFNSSLIYRITIQALPQLVEEIEGGEKILVENIFNNLITSIQLGLRLVLHKYQRFC